MIIRKSPSELEKMRASGMLVWRILDELTQMVEPGVTTLDLEKVAEKRVKEAGAEAAFKGYYVPAAGRRYPCVLCTSVNEEVVHGVPAAKRVLKEGISSRWISVSSSMAITAIRRQPFRWVRSRRKRSACCG